MIATLAAAILIQSSQAGTVAGRYELSDRLKELDVAWLNTKDVNRRKDALGDITEGVQSWFKLRYSEACEHIDEAIAKLEGRRHAPSDAISVRLANPFLEPGTSGRLTITWAYKPASVVGIRVAVGNKQVTVRPGESANLDVNPLEVNTDLRLNPEVGYLLPVRIGTEQKHVYVSLVKNAQKRINALGSAKSPFSREIGQHLQEVQSRPAMLDTELPLIQYLFSAEQVEEGRVKLADLEQVYYAKHGNTVLRAAFPKTLRGVTGEAVNVVVALHGQNGNENSFFETYGRGLAVSEALKRDWVFIAPRTDEGAAQDAVDWLQNVRGLKIKNVLLMGHSVGGGLVFLGPELNPLPSAMASFAPAASKVPRPALLPPTFMAVGKQDGGSLLRNARAVHDIFKDQPFFTYKEYEPTEHIMIVPDAVKDAYAFFEKHLK